MIDDTQENRRLKAAVEAAAYLAWDHGNAVGLDGWVGPERSEEPDDHATRERERYVRKLVAELLDPREEE